MKRILTLIVFLTLTLTACGQNQRLIDGLVVEFQTDGEGNPTSLVVEKEGKRTGVLIAEKTSFWPHSLSSGTPEEFKTRFLEELQADTLVTAWCYPRKDRLNNTDGSGLPAYWAISIDITGALNRNAAVLSDGTPLDVLEDYDRGRTYQLPDGTELLRVWDRSGPENVYVAGLESLDDLSEPVREKIRRYYEEQGLLYDEAAELERAYAVYLEQGDHFRASSLEQNVSPCGSSERVIYFQTNVITPLDYDEGTGTQRTICNAFDRRTGEEIDIRNLFGVPWEEVRRRIPALADWEIDPAAAAQMVEKLEPEYLIFQSDSLSVWFPAGTLEGEEYAYGFSVDYSAAPEGFFQPWAIPVKPET